jgi:hypothetical protein
MTEKRKTSQGYIIRILQPFATKLRNITNFVMLFEAVVKCLSRLVYRSKFCSLGNRSIDLFQGARCLSNGCQTTLHSPRKYVTLAIKPRFHVCDISSNSSKPNISIKKTYRFSQPANQNSLTFTNKGVMKCRTETRSFPLTNTNYWWLRLPDNTNFIMAKADY